jgi:alpha-N-acetylglucosamine transferase
MQFNKFSFKTIDLKTLLILVLGVALIISFFFGQKSAVDKHATEIKALHEENSLLLGRNDSLRTEIAKNDVFIDNANKVISNNSIATNKTQLELNKLKNKRNEIPNYVNALSANGTANAFTKYLNKRTEGNNDSKLKR